MAVLSKLDFERTAEIDRFWFYSKEGASGALQSLNIDRARVTELARATDSCASLVEEDHQLLRNFVSQMSQLDDELAASRRKRDGLMSDNESNRRRTQSVSQSAHFGSSSQYRGALSESKRSGAEGLLHAASLPQYQKEHRRKSERAASQFSLNAFSPVEVALVALIALMLVAGVAFLVSEIWGGRNAPPSSVVRPAVMEDRSPVDEDAPSEVARERKALGIDKVFAVHSF